MLSRQLIRQIAQWFFFITFFVGLPFVSYFYWDHIRFYWDYFALGTPCWIDPFFHIQNFFAHLVPFQYEYYTTSTLGTMTLTGFSLGFIIVLTLTFGRAFCSWVCPFGTLLDFIGKFREFLGLKHRHTPEILQERLIKYGVVIGFLGMSVLLRRTVFCDICPAGTMFRAAGQMTLSPTFIIVIPVIFLVCLIMFSLFFEERAWCKYLCPFGATIAAGSKLSPTGRVDLPMHGCLECKQCEKACPMDIPLMAECRFPILNDPKVKKTLKGLENPNILAMPKRFDMLPEELQEVLNERRKFYKVPAGECINCYQCVDVCPVVKKEKEAEKAAKEEAKKAKLEGEEVKE